MVQGDDHDVLGTRQIASVKPRRGAGKLAPAAAVNPHHDRPAGIVKARRKHIQEQAIFADRLDFSVPGIERIGILRHRTLAEPKSPASAPAGFLPMSREVAAA